MFVPWCHPFPYRLQFLGVWLLSLVTQCAPGIILPCERVRTFPGSASGGSFRIIGIFSVGYAVVPGMCGHHNDVIHVHLAGLVRPLKMASFSGSNVAGALQRPKGMTMNCHNP
jgi:hypothetical protein